MNQTKMQVKKEFQSLNERWPDFLKTKLQKSDYGNNLSTESIAFLKELKFIDGRFLQVPSTHFPRLELTFLYKGETLTVEGFPAEPVSKGEVAVIADAIEGLYGGDVLIPLGKPFMQKRTEGTVMAKLLTAFGLREVLMAVDGDNWEGDFGDGAEELEKANREKEKQTLIQQMNEEWPIFLKEELRNFEHLINLSDSTLSFLRGLTIVDFRLTSDFYALGEWGLDIGMEVEAQEWLAERTVVRVEQKPFHLFGKIGRHPEDGDYNNRVYIRDSIRSNAVSREEEEVSLSKILARSGFLSKWEMLSAQERMRDNGMDLPF